MSDMEQRLCRPGFLIFFMKQITGVFKDFLMPSFLSWKLALPLQLCTFSFSSIFLLPSMHHASFFFKSLTVPLNSVAMILHNIMPDEIMDTFTVDVVDGHAPAESSTRAYQLEQMGGK